MAFKIIDKAFWDKVDVSGECWIFQGRKYKDGKLNPNGYGHVTRRLVRPSSILAHKYAWYLYHGIYPGRWEFVCHRCDNPSCVRIDHLFLGTTQENTADRQAKGRGIKGEAHGGAKLTESQVIEIRRLYKAGGTSARKLAVVFGVRHPAILAIVNRKKWRHVG